jgi:hypothetical protein
MEWSESPRMKMKELDNVQHMLELTGCTRLELTYVRPSGLRPVRSAVASYTHLIGSSASYASRSLWFDVLQNMSTDIYLR